jgi:hypothetical protein
MTIYFLNGRPHIAMENHYKEISHYEFYMMIEHNEVSNVEDVNFYD